MSFFTNFGAWLETNSGQIAVAGLAGSAVSAAMEWTGVWPALRKIFVGVISAIYLSPIAVPILAPVLGAINVPKTNADSLSGYLMGVGGIIVMEIFLKAFRLRRDGVLKGGGHE